MLVPYTEHLGTFLSSMAEEIWKPVLGYEGLYEVSSMGNLRSIDRIVTKKDGRLATLKGVVRSVRLNKKRKNYQYRQTELSKNGVVKTFHIAHLVCEAFYGPRPEGYQCMHLDGNCANDRADNLAWGTVYENSNEPIRRRRLSEVARWNIPNLWRRGVYDSQFKPCLQYSLSGELIKEYRSIREAARETGVDHITITRACKGRYKTSGGYIWKFKEK